MCGQARRRLSVSNRVFSTWTWTVSLCPLGSDTDPSSKVSCFFFFSSLKHCAACDLLTRGPATQNSPSHLVHGRLAGKPVAVTSNRGHERVPLRPGARPQLELQYYQRKRTHPGELFLPHLSAMEQQTTLYLSYFMVHAWLSVRPSCLSDEELRSPDRHAEQDAATLSMAEIASCSYEAR